MSFVAELLKVYIELNFPVGREDIRVSQGLERLAIILCLHVSFQRLEPKTLYFLSGPSPVIHDRKPDAAELGAAMRLYLLFNNRCIGFMGDICC